MIDQALMEMIRYNGNDRKRINHALKVFGWVRVLAGELATEEQLNAELAAIFHDIGIHAAEKKYGSSAGKYQEIEGPPIARRLLEKIGCLRHRVKRVCFLVGHHHSYGAVDGADFQALIEADFLVNMDEEAYTEDQRASIKRKIFRSEKGLLLLDSLWRNK